MKTRTVTLPTRSLLICIIGAVHCAYPLAVQAEFIAYNAPAGTVGNQAINGLVVGDDFRVIYPITVSQLGVFDSGTNGIQGSTVLTVQLYERSGRHNGTLLATLTFDATDPGKRLGGSLFKPLVPPLTLLPGNYTIAAYGFDQTKPYGNAGTPPLSTNAPPPWTVNDGDGLIRFEGLSRFGRNGAGQYPGHLDEGPANRFAAGTFVFSPASLPESPHASDYAALTARIRSFPLTDTPHLGSIAVLTAGAFPVLVEMGGNRMVMEAAGTYDDNPNGARVVAFADREWGTVEGDARMQLFENAIQWAARKSNPADIVIGLGSQLDTNYFQARGYRVTAFNPWTTSATNPIPPCDVVVANWNIDYADGALEQLQQHVARGGGIVVTTTPKPFINHRVRSAFPRLDTLLQPFGLSYRYDLNVPADFGFTNIQSIAYPAYFSAYPAAALLYQDRVGQVRLNGQEKVIALNTITYASQGRPDLLASLTALYATGTTNSPATVATDPTMGDFVDVAVLTGAQARTNALSRWSVNGNALVAQDRRGAVEYDFRVPSADMYRFQVEGAQGISGSVHSNFDLIAWVDGVDLGRYTLVAGYGSNGVVNIWAPYLLAGSHTLRVFWDGAASGSAFQINALRVQTALGQDSNGDGIKDWVHHRISEQSGLDITNQTLASYVSPICLEGRDPYLPLISTLIQGADNQTVSLKPQPSPDNRWYMNVPLSAYANAQTTFQISYQNGAQSETRLLKWLPRNLLTDGDVTIRIGDSLLFNAKPQGAADANLQVIAGTNQLSGKTSHPVACRFDQPGVFQVTGTYAPGQATAQSRSITVNVVEHSFTNNPDCWVGRERDWDVPSVATQVVLEADAELFCEQTGTLPNNGVQLDLLTDEAQPRYILSRLGSGGPILASATANGFEVFAAPDTYNRPIETYPDGSRLVETMVILSPVLSDVTVQLRVIVGGVTFDDGTTYRELSATDFDALGQYKLRFILPASVPANCHSITVIQGASDLVGTY
jgi:hypothetical protein